MRIRFDAPLTPEARPSAASPPVVLVSQASDTLSTESMPPRPRKACNESRLQREVEVCGDSFKRDMAHIDPQYWCNLTHFI
ncbi:receptor activity-modifying protein 3-like protein, partial [Lates japonicus]